MGMLCCVGICSKSMEKSIHSSFVFFSFYCMDGDMLCFFSCDKCTYGKSFCQKRLLNAVNVNQQNK